MRVFKDVDIIASLRKIMSHNTQFYQTDFNYDIDDFKKAAASSHFLWMSRKSGTELFNERDAHIRNHTAHNSWGYYSDTMHYGVKAFAVNVKENFSGNIYGDIYELHYNQHIEEVRKNSFSARSADVTFKPNNVYPETTRAFDISEYNERWRAIIDRYGEAKGVNFNLNRGDDALLDKYLAESWKRRETEAVPANVGEFIREMVKERFHGYGYTKGDMVFTTPEQATAAIKHHIPVHVLSPDNTSDKATTTVDVNNALYGGSIFGMSGSDKKLLNFYMAGNTLADLPFSHAELSTIFQMALDRGKENIGDDTQRKAVDNIIGVLDTLLFSDDGRELGELELDSELENGVEQ